MMLMKTNTLTNSSNFCFNQVVYIESLGILTVHHYLANTGLWNEEERYWISYELKFDPDFFSEMIPIGFF